MKIYIVQKGDSLYEIAKKHGVALAELEKMNPQLTNPDKIMPGMKIKVPTGSMHVKKKEVPVKKEMPFKKEMPIKKEMPMKENVINKEMPMKENIINKEMPMKENVINKEVEIVINKEVPVKEKPVVEKPAPVVKKKPEKKAPEVKKPIFKEKGKEKTVEEPAPVKFKHSNIVAPTLPMKEEGYGKAEPLAKEKAAMEIPMMEDPFPNMITPKKDIGEDPAWQYPFEGYGSVTPPPTYYPGMGDPGVYGTSYTMPTMPAAYQTPMPVAPSTYQAPMPTMSTMPTYQAPVSATEPVEYSTGTTQPMPQAYPAMPITYQAASPCGCDGQPWYQGYQSHMNPYETTYYTPTYSYGEPSTTYGTSGYPTMPQAQTPAYPYGAGTYYPQTPYTQQAMPSYPTTQTVPGYSQPGMMSYGVDGYRTSDGYGNTQPYQPDFPKWGDED